MRRELLAIALAGAVVALAGCSSGTSGRVVAVGAESAPAQVAAAVFVQQWGQVLWGLVQNQTGGGNPVWGDPYENPDGTWTVPYTAADGTLVEMTQFLPPPDDDGRMEVKVTYPGGRTQLMVQSMPEWDGDTKTTTDWTIASADGPDVAYRVVVDDMGTWWDWADDTTTTTGTSTLPDGVTQVFTALSAGGQTALQAVQSDGSTFTWTVPLAEPDYAAPGFAAPSTGRYQSAKYDISFTLAATAAAPARWGSMVSDLGGGLSGDFSLDAGFAGSGRIAKGGDMTALLTWTRSGDTDVRFVTGNSTTVTPAGAALDCLLHRWQTLSALLAPVPGAFSAGMPAPLAARAHGRRPK